MKIALCQMDGPDPFSGGSAHGVFSTVSGEGCVEIPGQDRLGDRDGVL